MRLPHLNASLLVTMLLWGFNFVAMKLMLREMTPATAALGRWILMYAILVLLCKRYGVPFWPERSPRGTRIWIQGFLAMGAYMVLFTLGMKEATAAEGAIILGCSPVFTLLLAAAVGQERFNLGILGATLLAFAGVALVVGGAAHDTNAQIVSHLLLLASAAVWAVATIVSRPLVADADPLAMLTQTMPGGLIALLPFGALDLVRTPWSELTPTAWGSLLYFSLLAGVGGFLLFYHGVKQVGAPGAMLYQYLVSPLALLSSMVVLGVGMTPIQLVGLVVVLSGVMLANMLRMRLVSAPSVVE